jgi:hypothetical protein
MRPLLALSGAGAMARVLTQAVGGNDAEFTSIATLVAQLGLSGVFFWLYRSADAHSKKRDDQIIELAGSLGPIVTRATDILDRFERSVSSSYSRGGGPDDRLAATVQELVAELRERKGGP